MKGESRTLVEEIELVCGSAAGRSSPEATRTPKTTKHLKQPEKLKLLAILFLSILIQNVHSVPQSRGSPELRKPPQAQAEESQLEGSGSSVSPAPSGASSGGSSQAAPSSNFQCPEQFGYYTDTRDCTKYYVCVFGEVLHESCTGGLRFSRELQTCDWPRNVECPQAKLQQEAAQTTTPMTSTSPSAPSSSTSTTSTTSSSTTTTTATSGRQNAKESSEESESSEERGAGEANSLKGASLVFADEDSDPQQQSFDEAISPVITSDGTIHLHDGSGGTFALPPNPNRQQQPQPPEENERLDVFVKPLSSAGTPQRPLPAAGAGSRASQAGSMKLQAATLPQPRQTNQQQVRASQGFLASAGSERLIRPELAEAAGEDSTGGGTEETSGSASEDSTEEPNNNNNQDRFPATGGEPAEVSDAEEDGDTRPASKPPQRAFASQPQGYIPPVMAPNSPRQVNGGRMGQPQQQVAARQPSQLLSINNRQIDPSRHSFKPILLQSSGGGGQQADTNLIQNNLFNDNNHNHNRLQAENVMGNQDGLSSDTGGSDEQPPVQLVSNSRPILAGQLQLQQSSARSNLRPNANQTLSSQQRQEQQQMVAAAAVQAAALQNNRQSRMSANFQQQQQQQRAQFSQPNGQNANFQLSPNSMNSLPISNLNNKNLADEQELRQSRFFSPTNSPPAQHSHQLALSAPQMATTTTNQQSFLSNNVNFNDSSKLIRLQASHFEPVQPPAPPADSSQSSQQQPSSNNLFANNNNNRFQQPARSQSVLFSQRPFGLTGELAAEPAGSEGRLGASGELAGGAPPGGGSSLLQQQRRPRPPKRQQIPAGANNNNNRFRPNIQSGIPRTSLPASDQADLATTTLQPADFLMAGRPLDERTGRPLVTSTSALNLEPEGRLASSTPGRRPGELRGGQAQRAASSQPADLNQLPGPTGSTQPTTTSTSSMSGSAADEAAANRFLSSAMDALEAGQPFGTVDYDFDILGDNSTERRNQPAGAEQQPAAQAPANQRTNQKSPNANRQSAPADEEELGGPQTRPPGQQQPRARQSAGRQTTPQTLANQQQQQTTKKPRPTNKKISVSHEQALANTRASTEPAKRPEALYNTPTALQTASKCDTRQCRLPDCKCGDTLIPGALKADQIPQVVLLTFDDAVNDLNWEIYEELFTGKTNPNGCPILATFYVSHEWTDYGQVQTLYSRGHEIASHSVTHSFGEKFSKSQWFKEINGQREILNMYGGVKINDVRGMRAPFLQIGGNKMFEMLYDANFTYDSSMPIFENSPPLWPYTLDYQLTHECMITPCPTKSFPGVWEVGMTMWVDLRGGRCSMGDACSNPSDEDGVYEMLMKNFNRHYKSNRAPFGLFYHSAWFNTVHHRRGFLRFMGTVNNLPDVYFTTNWQMLQWMRRPTPLQEINNFEPWQCPAKNDRPPPCFHPSVCNVKSEHGTRFMKTCQPCPANQQYPWVGATGFKGGKSGSG